ncbi:hypothetical protein DIPPA_33554 [Diplonema papillatum]|nr:hypothetical protein DIPPA_33554 [Diplonema papillatum]|eukprot:gene5282-8065_t
MQNVDFEGLARRSCEGVLASAAALYAAELWEQKVAFVLETAAEQSAAANALRELLALEREQREYERAISYVKQKAAADAVHRRRSPHLLSISMRSSFA